MKMRKYLLWALLGFVIGYTGTLVAQSDPFNVGCCRYGDFSVSGQLKASDGSATAPSMSFLTDLDTGFYSDSGGIIRGTVNGQNVWSIASSSFNIARASTSAGPNLLLNRSQGTDLATPTSVANGDTVFRAGGLGYSSLAGGYISAADIFMQVDGTPNQSAADMPGRIQFRTSSDGSATPTTRFTIDSSGQLTGGSGTNTIPTYSYTSDSSTGVYLNGVGILGFSAGGTIRAQITSGGITSQTKFGANGDTSPGSYFDVTRNTFSSANGFGLSILDSDTAADSTNILSRIGLSADSSAAGVVLMNFEDSDGSIGSIVIQNSTSILYNTTSDSRLKKDGVEISDGITRVKQLSPKYFKWIEDGSDGEGFYAQELALVIPTAVSGTPDGPRMMGIDYGRLTPVLTAALKETVSRLEALEQEFSTYKAAHP